jgi:elongation factor Ts
VISSYVHSNAKNAAIVVAKSGTDTDKLRQVAMHVVASAPQVVSPTEISDDIVAKEREIQLEIMKQDPKNA